MTSTDHRPPRHCIKCGREIGPDESICEVCNHAGMATPSASQYHGTIVVAIIAGVVGLAIWGSLALRGVGPYAGSVIDTLSDPPDGVQVSVEVENQGTKSGFASCLLSARDAQGRTVRTRSVSLGPIAGGQVGEFTERIGGLAELPGSVIITCDG
jgi:predicted nucleic acid-binding Zn ribbon protein